MYVCTNLKAEFGKNKSFLLYLFMKSIFPTFRCSRFSNYCISKYKLQICVGTTCFKPYGERPQELLDGFPPLLPPYLTEECRKQNGLTCTADGRKSACNSIGNIFSKFAKPVSLQIGRKSRLHSLRRKNFVCPSKQDATFDQAILFPHHLREVRGKECYRK